MMQASVVVVFTAVCGDSLWAPVPSARPRLASRGSYEMECSGDRKQTDTGIDLDCV